ncbi:MAG TPA: Holliday junction branch migration protein RuvA [bacterium]|nr:Holliday junction branch migration protein RuvA [bacterium]HPT30107.1 Holliday junction branch migration protein RuvA [bacterium]
MISYLRGKILAKTKGQIILDVNQVGYRLAIAETWLAELVIGAELELYIHQHVKEDALDLYGFKTLADLEFFELLISVNGVGPRSALAILAIASADDIGESIARGDAHLLTKVSGIGRKIADRIVLELKNKLGQLSFGTSLNNSKSDEIDALMALGYSLMQAREALNQVSPEIRDSGERIREALKSVKKP